MSVGDLSDVLGSAAVGHVDYPRGELSTLHEGSSVSSKTQVVRRWAAAASLCAAVAVAPTVVLATVPPSDGATSSEASTTTVVDATTTIGSTSTTTTVPATSLAPTTTVAPSSTSTTTAVLTTVQSPSRPETPVSQPAAVVAAIAPSTPLSYRVTSVGDGRVALVWTTPTTGTPSGGYRLAYAPAGGSWNSINLGIRTSWTISGLQNGATYYIYLYAMADGLQSAPAKLVVTLRSGTPLSFRATSVGDSRISLAWSTPASGVPSSGFRLVYAPAGGSWTSVNLGVRTSWTISGLRNGMRYYLYLYAKSGGFEAAPATTSAVPGSRPGAVPLPQVTNSNQAVGLKWTAPNNGGYPITGYVVQIGTNGVWRNLTTLPGSARSYTVRNLVNGRSYYFRIAAVNRLGTGAWSRAVLGRPVAPPPPFGDGTHLVGSQVRPGLYVSSGGTGCYWERLSGLGGTFDEIIANDFLNGRTFVQIMSTDRAFSSSGCGTWRLASSVAPVVVGSTFGGGTYRVNIELRPGLYRSSGGIGCYWERLSGFNGEFDDIIANDFLDGATYVQIASTDVGFYADADCGTWTRVS
jgi:hypothetical protein